MDGNVLAQLKDIHQPPAISFWPPAPGWYFIAGLLIIAISAYGGVLYKRWLRKKYKQQILDHIDQLHAEYRAGKQREAITQLSVLLRRAALDCFPRQDVAGLHGHHWLTFLEHHCPAPLQISAPFTHGCGQILISAPYQPTANTHADELFDLIKIWVDHNLFGKRRRKLRKVKKYV